MIILQTDRFQIDLSSYGVSLSEENSLFSDNIYKSFSLPFNIDADPDLLSKLNIPTIDNITDLDTNISCRLLLPDRHYKATLYLNEIVGQKISCNLIFGQADLPVYDTQLSSLPWPLVVEADILAKANTISDQSWPAVRYNFPMIYRPEISGSEYDNFLGFMNNHDGSAYLNNYVDNSGTEPVYHNRNVMTPCVYLLEILKFGYQSAGKKVFGEIFNHPALQKALFVPKDFLEKFRGSEYQQFSFGMPTTSEASYQNTYGVYTKNLTLNTLGSYELQYKLNLDPVIASFFEFRIFTIDPLTEAETDLYTVSSKDNRVNLDEKLTINVEADIQYHTLRVELRLKYNTESIAATNSFEFSFSGGLLNEFPTSFSLADFMPKMKFGEYVNMLKNWWNLDIDIDDQYVNISFAQDSVLKKPVVAHDHLEIPDPGKTFNANRIYKLSYANGEKVIFNKSGQVFSEQEEEGADIIPLEMDLQPLLVEQNEDIITAVYPEDTSDLDFCLYDGKNSAGKPTCSYTLAKELSLQKVLDNWWVKWLTFRVRSKTFKESFECSVYERINIDELSFKYNELHVIKKLQKKFKSESVMEVTVESETF